MIGRIIGPYEVVASIGRGGMGEVFRARDQKLGREVALKILPPELARDPDRLARFQREARVLASLQHQNIAAIYGLEEMDGQPVLAMELAAGEDLSTRLLRGPLPDNEIEKIASQLAQGLEYAHEQGIVHRDLKPANVKVSGEGTVKILDFGLARAFTADSVAEGDAESHSYQPTITQALTGSGTVLGTAAYMSPEQARGYEVDRRSDIWAFGVILHEMMTGERLFEGETATDTLAAVLHKEPDWDALAAAHPEMLVQICRRCLEKDQRQRLRDIGEARVALDGSHSSFVGLTTTGLAPAPPLAVKASRMPWLVAAVATVLLALALVAIRLDWFGPEPAPWPLVQSTVDLPVDATLNVAPAGPGLPQVSPDGNYLAYAAVDSGGEPEVFVRNLAEGWTRRLNGTKGTRYPFWGPRSREVGFFERNGRMMRVPLNGGPAVPIVNATNPKGGSWNQFDEIVYAPTHMSSIMMVPATGGDPVAVTHVDREPGIRSHRLPQWLPDGRHFLYVAVTKSDNNPELDCQVRVTEAATGKTVELLRTQSSVQFAAGHLLYPHDGVLMARPLDVKTMAFTGPAFPILQDVMMIRGAHLSGFSVSAAGVLIYMRSTTLAGGGPLLRYSAAGEEKGLLGARLNALGFDFSPDGTRICAGVVDDRSGTLDLWQLELSRNLSTRLTFEPESEWQAVYAPDGQTLAFMGDRRGHGGIYSIPASGGGELTPLVENDDDNYPGAFSPDGRFLYYTGADSLGGLYLSRLALETGQDVRLHPGASYYEMFPDVSPDGKWLAYVSRETGGSEVFVEGVDGASGRWRVSTAGGAHPKWSPGGDLIYYVDQGNALFAVPVSVVAGALRFGGARKVLDRLEPNFTASYDIDPVTGDIAAQRMDSGGATGQIQLVTGWQNLLTTAGKD